MSPVPAPKTSQRFHKPGKSKAYFRSLSRRKIALEILPGSWDGIQGKVLYRSETYEV
jgi:hypothetical protein